MAPFQASRPPTAGPASAPLQTRTQLYRYFFYGWLFRDAFDGSASERASALRHNREQARWLPRYMLRWAVVGAMVWGLQTVVQHWSGDSLPAAALALCGIYALMYELLTAICWAFLRSRR